ncbi:MAG: multicopper oxidase domain-containing protein, partial [Chloroflexia bacterium]|nr:multicopper oxidase domain-containing protein [Chloroflexia bacterium]
MDSQDTSPPSRASAVTRRALLRRAGIGGVAAGLLAAASSQTISFGGQPRAATRLTATPGEVSQRREFELTAQEFDWEISAGTVVRAWGYNGQASGPELRVGEGDLVRVTLRNELSVPTTIHWHGINLRPAMDGVAGLNQAAVPPGEEFIYEFTATPGGSRWYHSHTDPALQVPMGLYGPLIVEPRQPVRTHDREFTYIFGEWDLELTPDVATGRA